MLFSMGLSKTGSEWEEKYGGVSHKEGGLSCGGYGVGISAWRGRG